MECRWDPTHVPVRGKALDYAGFNPSIGTQLDSVYTTTINWVRTSSGDKHGVTPSSAAGPGLGVWADTPQLGPIGLASLKLPACRDTLQTTPQ